MVARSPAVCPAWMKSTGTFSHDPFFILWDFVLLSECAKEQEKRFDTAGSNVLQFISMMEKPFERLSVILLLHLLFQCNL